MEKIYIYYKNELLGYLFIDKSKGDEYYFFQYSSNAIKNNLTNIILDPNIYPILEKQFMNNPKQLFPFISDCCPDRWGRNLILRNEIHQASLEKRSKHKLFESDFLLGLSDELRMGALQFKLDENGEYVSSGKDIPPMVYLRKLEDAAYDIDELDENINILLSPGSSLGGARPKANVYDNEKQLWIAKFPHKHDEYDIQGYEKVVNDLAKLVGINVPESKLIKLSDKGNTFLVKRFDRDHDERIHFSSFMSLLGANDGESSLYSYLDLVTKIKAISNKPNQDLLELFKRVAFNIIICNGDDHLRNHGMLYKDKEWSLAPCYDINPSLDKYNLSLNIDENNSNFDLNILIKTARYYQLDENKAKQIIDDMINIVKNKFIDIANSYHLPLKQSKLFFNNFTLTY